MVYLLLFAGAFMGWSLGTNDASNAFGTAVATGVVKYRTAVILCAVMVVLGAFFAGSGNIFSVSELAVSNEVMATEEMAKEAVEAGTQDELLLKSALKAAIIFACAGLTVFVMTYLKITVSSNQAIIGAIIGWGLCYADYSDPAVLAVNLPQIGKFAATWLINPVSAALISFVIVKIFNALLAYRLSKLVYYELMIKIGYLIAGSFSAFIIGMNSSADVTALYYDGIADGVQTNLLTDARLAATLGGAAIALGVLTYSRKVMMTVGSRIAVISQTDGFLVIIATALTVMLMGKIMHIPVSTSQALVGAIVGAGFTKSKNSVHFDVFKKIAIAWVSSPCSAGTLSFLVGYATRGFFGT